MATKRCPHAKSGMTPCVIRDGAIAYAIGSGDKPICVGCEKSPKAIGVTGPDPVKWALEIYKHRNSGGRR